jgi:hypothetical protein
MKVESSHKLANFSYKFYGCSTPFFFLFLFIRFSYLLRSFQAPQVGPCPLSPKNYSKQRKPLIHTKSQQSSLYFITPPSHFLDPSALKLKLPKTKLIQSAPIIKMCTWTKIDYTCGCNVKPSKKAWCHVARNTDGHRCPYGIGRQVITEELYKDQACPFCQGIARVDMVVACGVAADVE